MIMFNSSVPTVHDIDKLTPGGKHEQCEETTVFEKICCLLFSSLSL